MIVVYIAHPLGQGPDREQNRAEAARWVAWAAARGVAPVATWITLSGEWSEAPELRAAGLAIDLALIPRCDEFWLCGPRISPGMQLELDAALASGRVVRRFVARGPAETGGGA